MILRGKQTVLIHSVSGYPNLAGHSFALAALHRWQIALRIQFGYARNRRFRASDLGLRLLFRVSATTWQGFGNLTCYGSDRFLSNIFDLVQVLPQK